MKSKSVLIKSFIVVLIASIFITLAIFNGDENRIESESSKLVSQYNFDNCCGAFETEDGNVFFCSKDSIKFLNNKAQEKWSIDTDFSEPIICHNKKIIGVSQANLIYVYDQTGELYSIKSENKLLSFSVNETGYCSCITKDNSAYKINLYNPSGEKILTYVHSEENIYPTNTAISPDANILAISYIDTNNIQIDSKITFMHTDQNDMFASVQEKDNFVCGLEFLSNNDIMIIGENKIIAVAFSKNNLKEKWRLNFGKRIGLLDFNNRFVAVKLIDQNGNISQSKSQIEFYNMSGKKLGQFNSNEQINFLRASAKSDCVMLNSLDNFVCVNSSGKLLWKYDISGEQKFACFVGKSNKVLFVGSTKAYLVSVK